MRLLRLSADGFMLLLFLASIGLFLLGLERWGADPRMDLMSMLISVPVAILVALSFLIGVQRRIKVSIFLFSVLVVLHITNIVIDLDVVQTHIPRLQGHVLAAKAAGVVYDPRSRDEVVADIRASGLSAYVSPIPATLLGKLSDGRSGTASVDAILPLGGISYATTVLCNEHGQYVIYKADRYGWNNDDTVYDNRNGGQRIMLVGQSFTHGNCVAPGENIAGGLRQRGFNAISLGMGGNGPLFDLAGLREYGSHLNPDIVLWDYFVYDLPKLTQESNDPFLAQYLDPNFTQNLIQRQAEVDAFWETSLEGLERARGTGRVPESTLRKNWAKKVITLGNLRTLAGMYQRSIPKDNPMESDHLRDFSIILEQAKETVAAMGSKFYFVYLPDYHPPGSAPHTHGKAEVLAIVNELQIPVIDFDTLLDEQEDRASFFRYGLNGHYTAEGFSLLTDLIEEKIAEGG